MNEKKHNIELKSSVFKCINAEFISSIEKVLTTIDSTEKYTIEIAFYVKNINHEVAVYLSFWINRKAKVPGYAIHTQSFNYFNWPEKDKNEMTKKEKEVFEQQMLEIAIQTTRNKIIEITGPFPIGPYEIPKIDIGELYAANYWNPNKPEDLN